MSPILLRRSVPLIIALALAAGLAVAGEPATPLGKWMKPNMGAPLAGQDFAALQKAFDLVAGKPPPTGDYGKWAATAQEGSAAAAKQDLAAVKAACKHCHDPYKEKYKKEFVDRPFP
jgi:cytochrome c553